MDKDYLLYSSTNILKNILMDKNKFLYLSISVINGLLSAVDAFKVGILLQIIASYSLLQCL